MSSQKIHCSLPTGNTSVSVCGGLSTMTPRRRPPRTPASKIRVKTKTTRCAFRAQRVVCKMEAEGIEPSSQDSVVAGLYMLSICFDLDPTTDQVQPVMSSSRLY